MHILKNITIFTLYLNKHNINSKLKLLCPIARDIIHKKTQISVSKYEYVTS